MANGSGRRPTSTQPYASCETSSCATLDKLPSTMYSSKRCFTACIRLTGHKSLLTLLTDVATLCYKGLTAKILYVFSAGLSRANVNLHCCACQHTNLNLTCSGEVLLADGKTWKACALKVVPFNSRQIIEAAEKELQALYAALGQAYLVQGVAAIRHTSPQGQHCLCILTEYVHVLHLLVLQHTASQQFPGMCSHMRLRSLCIKLGKRSEIR